MAALTLLVTTVTALVLLPALMMLSNLLLFRRPGPADAMRAVSVDHPGPQRGSRDRRDASRRFSGRVSIRSTSSSSMTARPTARRKSCNLPRPTIRASACCARPTSRRAGAARCTRAISALRGRAMAASAFIDTDVLLSPDAAGATGRLSGRPCRAAGHPASSGGRGDNRRAPACAADPCPVAELSAVPGLRLSRAPAFGAGCGQLMLRRSRRVPRDGRSCRHPARPGMMAWRCRARVPPRRPDDRHLSRRAASPPAACTPASARPGAASPRTRPKAWRPGRPACLDRPAARRLCPAAAAVPAMPSPSAILGDRDGRAGAIALLALARLLVAWRCGQDMRAALLTAPGHGVPARAALGRALAARARGAKQAWRGRCKRPLEHHDRRAAARPAGLGRDADARPPSRHSQDAQAACERRTRWRRGGPSAMGRPEVMLAEILPLAAACRFLERRAALLLAPRRVRATARPLGSSAPALHRTRPARRRAYPGAGQLPAAARGRAAAASAGRGKWRGVKPAPGCAAPMLTLARHASPQRVAARRARRAGRQHRSGADGGCRLGGSRGADRRRRDRPDGPRRSRPPARARDDGTLRQRSLPCAGRRRRRGGRDGHRLWSGPERRRHLHRAPLRHRDRRAPPGLGRGAPSRPGCRARAPAAAVSGIDRPRVLLCGHARGRAGRCRLARGGCDAPTRPRCDARARESGGGECVRAGRVPPRSCRMRTKPGARQRERVHARRCPSSAQPAMPPAARGDCARAASRSTT